ncbi:MAG: FMN-binding protein [Gemmatimonadota bacterium]|nr:FMN-binding protein [Gemmatimonadota bacterium]
MNRDRKDPVTLAFGVLLVALVPTFFLLASRYQSLDERVRRLQPKPFVPVPSPEDLLAQVSQVVSDSTLQLQPVWAAEPEPTSGLVADYNVVRRDQTVYRLVLFRHDIACSVCRDVLAAALYDAEGDTLVQILLLDYWEVRGERVDTARFLLQFAGRSVASELALEFNVDGISGATFSAGGLVEQLNKAAAWVRDQPLGVPASEEERL